MRTGLIAICALAATAMAVPATAKAPMRHDPVPQKVVNVSTRGDGPAHQRITLALGKAALVQLDADARDVLVSSPDIVDAVVRTPRRIFLLAQKSGQTNAFFFDAAGHQILSIDIRVERDVTDLSGMMRQNFPRSNVHISAMNDNVVLTGTVASATESSRAQDLAASFTGDPKKVVNMIKIQANEQVMLKVRVAEMQRQIAKQFGVNVSEAAIAAGVPIIASTGNQFGLIGRALSDASGAQFGSVCPAQFLPKVTSETISKNPGTTATTTTSSVPCHAPNNLQGILQALDQIGLMHTLAEPNLTAVSGETARFLAGGEFPVPAGRDQQGNISIIFKQFGVGLSFTPVVLSENRISLQVSTEVSELTNTGAFTLSGGVTTDPTTGQIVSAPGLTIPALNVRRAQTTVELPSGGSFAIAGLLQQTNKQVINQFPGLGNMPVLGALFRSRDYQNNETELVVMVSAYMVRPTSEKHLSAPTDHFVPPNDLDTILMGRLNAEHPAEPDTLKSASNAKNGFIVQ
ncbi:MAG: type II and III secretion system protein family protein [Alphaproteobacteria bacterium]|nr:type II and III secretion system protein family protein [Alphaproteobacteria bacterium]